jgi:hypothetical protein
LRYEVSLPSSITQATRGIDRALSDGRIEVEFGKFTQASSFAGFGLIANAFAHGTSNLGWVQAIQIVAGLLSILIDEVKTFEKPASPPARVEPPKL